jgi:hypothetical protein
MLADCVIHTAVESLRSLRPVQCGCDVVVWCVSKAHGEGKKGLLGVARTP